MSKMVTSRIPNEMYVQGASRLAALGLGVSDLVRAAYEYLLQTGEMPKAPAGMTGGRRDLSEESMAELKRKLDASRLSIALPEDWDYKTALAEGRWADYEALA